MFKIVATYTNISSRLIKQKKAVSKYGETERERESLPVCESCNNFLLWFCFAMITNFPKKNEWFAFGLTLNKCEVIEGWSEMMHTKNCNGAQMLSIMFLLRSCRSSTHKRSSTLQIDRFHFCTCVFVKIRAM